MLDARAVAEADVLAAFNTPDRVTVAPKILNVPAVGTDLNSNVPTEDEVEASLLLPSPS
jgi:hypothetical protein